MPDTPIDLSEGIQSVRLKVPTAEVPIPPVGFAQLHSPAPGALALRLPDGSVVVVGGGGGGGGAATAVLGPGGAIDAANSDPRIGININAAPGTGIGFTGRFLDQFAKPLGVQVDTVLILSAELLTLDTIPKVLAAAQGVGKVPLPLLTLVTYTAGSTPYNSAGPVNLQVGWPGGSLDFDQLDISSGLADGSSYVFSRIINASGGSFDLRSMSNQPLVLSLDAPLTDGDGVLTATVIYLVL